MNNKVYILQEFNYDESYIMGVFTTKYAAEKHLEWIGENIKKKPGRIFNPLNYEISEHGVFNE